MLSLLIFARQKWQECVVTRLVTFVLKTNQLSRRMNIVHDVVMYAFCGDRVFLPPKKLCCQILRVISNQKNRGIYLCVDTGRRLERYDLQSLVVAGHRLILLMFFFHIYWFIFSLCLAMYCILYILVCDVFPRKVL